MEETPIGAQAHLHAASCGSAKQTPGVYSGIDTPTIKLVSEESGENE